MPHYPKIATMGARPEAYPPKPAAQPLIPVRPPSPQPTRTPGKGLSLQPKSISLVNWDVDPMSVIKHMFGTEADVDESTGTVQLRSNTQKADAATSVVPNATRGIPTAG